VLVDVDGVWHLEWDEGIRKDERNVKWYRWYI
jgi:hypothetical protein